MLLELKRNLILRLVHENQGNQYPDDTSEIQAE